MKLRIESYEYNRDHGSFSVIAKEGEQELLTKLATAIASKDGIDGISQGEYAADFAYCKSEYDEDLIRAMWKVVKKNLNKSLTTQYQAPNITSSTT